MTIEFMEFTHEDKARFEPYLGEPDMGGLYHNIDDKDFERFLGYMFFCAGFAVEHSGPHHIPHGPGVDLNLYLSPTAKKPFARIEAKHLDPAGPGVSAGVVLHFAGVLAYAGDIQGYLISTSSIHANGQHIVDQPGMQKVHLVDGETLARYITYIYGSRVTDGHGFHRTAHPILPDWLNSNIAQEPRSWARILAVANNKGGVGKTTSALNVGFALSALGKRVLLVDMDGQANLTSVLPPRLPKQAPKDAPATQHTRSISEHFSPAQTSLQELIQLTRFENIWLLPADAELHRIEPGSSARPDDELAFARQLRSPELGLPSVGSNEGVVTFDWIVIDTPPAQSHFARLALAAADYVLVPLKADSFSVAGINNALQTTNTMRALTNVPQRRGLLLTQWRSVRSMKDIEAKLNTQALAKGYPLLDTIVPYDDHIEQAHISLIGGGTKNLFGWKTTSAAQAYKSVTSEILG